MNAASTPVWISEQQIVSLMNLSGAIEALEAGLAQQASGAARNMGKTHVAWGHSNLHAIGAAFQDAGIVGTKTWAHTEGGACPLLILFDSANGQLKAILEAFALGQMRTGGISGVATKWLARPDADVLALIGTGKQALAQLAAVAAVRRLKLVRVYSPTPDKRRAFVERAREKFDIEIVEAPSVEAAVADAPIVTTVTRATEAFLPASALAYGTHVNAVGAITEERIELADDVFARCTRAVVDDLGAAKRLSTEFVRAYGARDAWNEVAPLCDVIAEGRARTASDDITVFKAMGMGVSDLALGLRLYALALEAGLGSPLPQPRREPPRLN
ncbi:ornithine cyclodeaminase family protein [Paraburkholderia hospita]|jgi:ornithine cyclodeaminase|uniref:Ornithine cyclodeaminase n=1 Tax=Paraburkholderia hospita TaxID=169430 RepID=A0AAN1MPQ9_9BURK|nr:ornithine cyclodeaminase family protein [Paraburkholderia hospita]AUT74993.1 ornithine cyclodeaminase [Paraburkholderia hospita]EIM94847.1 ornithine cyclodeaminase Ocd [Paraburkholderia hospita]OUL74840.1 ornithine cyclodeaminase [Paraburkholderia hospita]OUL86801.1 ornithine cyclodeaminase [Paraburkholderia hospita]SEH71094.1 ornithine cyclodeaminase [Paraburkholderia hospita]